MNHKKLIILFVILVDVHSDLIVRNGSCKRPCSLKGSFKKFNGKLWYLLANSIIAPNQKCFHVVLDTYSNGRGVTNLTGIYVDSSSGSQTIQTGSLTYDPKGGPFTVDFPGYPANGNYYLLDFKNGAGTYYLCFDLGNGLIGEVAFVYISDLPCKFSELNSVIKRSKKVLRKMSFDTSQLKLLDQSCFYC